MTRNAARTTRARRTLEVAPYPLPRQAAVQVETAHPLPAVLLILALAAALGCGGGGSSPTEPSPPTVPVVPIVAPEVSFN